MELDSKGCGMKGSGHQDFHSVMLLAPRLVIGKSTSLALLSHLCSEEVGFCGPQDSALSSVRKYKQWSSNPSTLCFVSEVRRGTALPSPQ